MNLSRIRTLQLGVLSAVLLTSASSQTALWAEALQNVASSQTGPSPARPANVPASFVVTPFGYMHSSCVRTLSRQDAQLADGRIQHANGEVEALGSCSYPRYAKDGSTATAGVPRSAAVSASGKDAVNVSGGEDASVWSGSDAHPYGALHGIWMVPDEPRADDQQFLFYWQGFEDYDNVESVLQPVLEWNDMSHWSIASWNCCLSGIAVRSEPVFVSTGDLIYGSITSTCPAGLLSCPAWNVLTLDMTTGQSTLLANTPSEGQIMSWAFGAFLEPYGVVRCADYPADGRLKFWDVTLFDVNLKPVHDPQWQNDEAGVPHGCDFKVKTDPREITLFY